LITENPNEASADRLSPVEILLAALWIILPAVQYVGTYKRTAAVVAREIPRGGLERLDLTPWYVLLVGLTLVYFILKIMARRTRGAESAE
jgi:hypothetical protein